jgi:DNA-binding NarL/FixJ family response regulator
MPSEMRVVIVDDHPIFRQGLRQLIEKERFITVVAEADNGDSALELITVHRPDVAVLDVDMPRKDGFQVARRVQQLGLPTQVVFLTLHKDEMHLNEALTLGVKGYVIKESAASDIAHCLRAVAAGKSYISAELSSYLLNRGRRASEMLEKHPSLSDLTTTERQILRLLAGYKTNREISAELFVSVRTVENHRASICSKLQLRGTHALMKFALKRKDDLV